MAAGIWTTTTPDDRPELRDAETPGWEPLQPPATYRVEATPDLALAMGVHDHTPLFVHDRLLTPVTHEDGRGQSGRGDTQARSRAGRGSRGGGRGQRESARRGGRRMVHRLYLPFTTCTEIPALAEHPFPTPDELYTQLTTTGHHLGWTETVRVATPAADDTTSLHLPIGGLILLTRRLTTSQGRTLALEETRRPAEDTQLTYTLTPTPPPPLSAADPGIRLSTSQSRPTASS